MNLHDIPLEVSDLQTAVILRYRPPVCCRSARFIISQDRDHYPISLLGQTTESEINNAIGEINRVMKMTSTFRWRLWPSVFLLIAVAFTSVYFIFSLFDNESIREVMPWITHQNLIILAIGTLSVAGLLLLYLSCIARMKNAPKVEAIGQVLWYLNNRFVGRLYWQLSKDSKQRPLIIIREASAAYMIGPEPDSDANEYVPLGENSRDEFNQFPTRKVSSGCKHQ